MKMILQETGLVFLLLVMSFLSTAIGQQTQEKYSFDVPLSDALTYNETSDNSTSLNTTSSAFNASAALLNSTVTTFNTSAMIFNSTVAPSSLNESDKVLDEQVQVVLEHLPAYARNWTCLHNLHDYTLSFDVQLRFGSNNSSVITPCSMEEEINLVTSVPTLLNQVFQSRVPGWKGDVFFGAFQFDTKQQQVNVAKRRQLRGGGGGAEEANIRILGETASADCPQRRGIDCEGDICLWGCLPVATSDCGVSSLANWVYLIEDVKASLALMNYACLGDTMELKVDMIIDEDQEYAITIHGQNTTIWP